MRIYMSPITARLRSLRYLDDHVLRGKRMVIGLQDRDPCDYTGHEDVMAFMSIYVDDIDIPTMAFRWDEEAIAHLNHITECHYCMARVFSTPDAELNAVVQSLIAHAK